MAAKSRTKEAPPSKRTRQREEEEETKPPARAKEREVAEYNDEDFNKGFENVTSKDVILPRLTILQSLSPQLQKRDPLYIPGASVGQFCDTGINKAWDELLFIPCYFAVIYLEWAPRNSGRGLVFNHGINPAILQKTTPNEKRKPCLPNGNYIAETATYFGLNLTNDAEPSFIPMSSTQLKNSRRWMRLLRAQKSHKVIDGVKVEGISAMYNRPWEASTKDEGNTEGTWLGWSWSPYEKTTRELDKTGALYSKARNFYDQMRMGMVRLDMVTDEQIGHSEEGGGGAM